MYISWHENSGVELSSIDINIRKWDLAGASSSLAAICMIWDGGIFIPTPRNYYYYYQL